MDVKQKYIWHFRHALAVTLLFFVLLLGMSLIRLRAIEKMEHASLSQVYFDENNRMFEKAKQEKPVQMRRFLFEVFSFRHPYDLA